MYNRNGLKSKEHMLYHYCMNIFVKVVSPCECRLLLLYVLNHSKDFTHFSIIVEIDMPNFYASYKTHCILNSVVTIT